MHENRKFIPSMLNVALYFSIDFMNSPAVMIGVQSKFMMEKLVN